MIRPRWIADVRRARTLLVAIVMVAGVCGVAPERVAAEGTQRSSADGADRPCALYQADVPGVPDVANPFDPAQVNVRVTFSTAGRAAIAVAAFASIDQSRALVSGHEQLTAVGGLHWLVRFTPPAPGTWTWKAHIDAGPIHTETPSTSFTCEADPQGHGRPIVSPANGAYLAYSDGTSFVPIGENLAWYGSGGTFDYDRWLDSLAAHGATWIRVWMPSWAMGIEVAGNPLGDYRNRMGQAWQLDHVLAAAYQRGIVVQLVLLNHGAFSTTHNSEWDQNPYNVANGGFLTDPTQFFTNTHARQLFERRLDYITARWAAYPNLIWELWNEVDLTDASPAAVGAWHAAMVPELRSLDPYGHLVTTSVSAFTDFFSSTPRWAALWRQPDIDLVQVHLYGLGNALPLNLTVVASAAMQRARSFGKPVALSEVGIDAGSNQPITDDGNRAGAHEGAWIGFFSGGVGGGMNWWWDSIVEPQHLYGPILDGLHALAGGIDPAQERFAPGEATATSSSPSEPSLQVFTLLGKAHALVWLRNPDSWWHQLQLSPVPGASVALDGLPSGTWESSVVDPYTGAAHTGPSVVSNGTVATLTLGRSFSSETALRLTRVGDAPPATAPPTNIGVQAPSPPATPIVAQPRLTG